MLHQVINSNTSSTLVNVKYYKLLPPQRAQISSSKQLLLSLTIAEAFTVTVADDARQLITLYVVGTSTIIKLGKNMKMPFSAELAGNYHRSFVQTIAHLIVD